MKIKEYPKSYENFYTRKRSEDRCLIENVSTDLEMSTKEYTEFAREKFGIFEKTMFDMFVRQIWVVRRFCYKGIRRKKYFANGHTLDGAFGVFMRKHVGFDNKMFNSQQHFRIISYLDDFFPEFDLYNPFEEPEKYKYPYKNVKLCHMFMVYKMDERLELLQIAEDRNMGYTKFVDYVINYAMSYNNDIGRDKYKLSMADANTPYIINTDITKEVDTFEKVKAKK